MGLCGRLVARMSDSKQKPARKSFKIHEAAELLGVSASSIRRLIARGHLRSVRVLRHVLIPATELDRLLHGVER